MATNLLGSAYVRIVPKIEGFGRVGEEMTRQIRASVGEAMRLNEQFADTTRTARQAAGDVGGIGDAARAAAGDAAQLAGQLEEAGREGEQAAERTESGWKSAFGKIGGGAKTAFAGVGVAAGTAFAVGLNQAMEAQAGGAKLAAQLGLDAKAAASASRVTAKIYGDAWGDSMESVSEAVRGVYTNIGEGNEQWLRDTAEKATAVADIWGSDIGEVTAAVGQMLNTGMARSADEAFDIIASGFQNGNDKAGDFLATLNEYSTQFRRVGIDGATASGLITQAMQAGARDSDQVADALGQFGELALGGSTAVRDAFASIGVNADDMAAKIGRGGPAAASALQTTLNALRNTGDQQVRLNAQTALFGDPGAVMGAALTAMNPAAIAAAGGIDSLAGSMDKSMQAMEGSASRSVESIKRQFLGGLGNIAATVLPPLTAGLSKVGEAVGPAFGNLKETVGGVVSDLLPKIRDFGESIQPGVQAIADFATNSAWPALQDLGVIFQGLWDDIQPVAEIVRDVLVVQFNAIWSVISNQLGPALTGLTGFIRDNQTLIKSLAVAVGAGVAAFYAYKGAVAAVETAQWIWRTRTLLTQAVMVGFRGAIAAVRGGMLALRATMAANPLGVALIAIAALVAGFIYAYKHSETFRNIVNAVFTTIRDVVMSVLGVVKDFFIGAWNVMYSVGSAVVNGIKDAVSTAWNVIKTVTSFVWDAIKFYFQTWWLVISTVFTTAIDVVKAVVSGAWDAIKFVTSLVWDGIKLYFQLWWLVLSTAFRTAVDIIRAVITGAWDAIRTVTSTVWDGIKLIFTTAVNGIKTTAETVMNTVKGGFDTALGAIKTAFQTTVDGIKTIWEGIKKAAGVPVNFVIGTVYNNGIRKAFNFVAKLLPGVDELPEAGMIQLRSGGRLPGYGGGDILPALLEPGEAVVPKHLEAIQKLF